MRTYVVWLFILILILQGTVTLAQNSKPLRPKSSHAFFDPDAINRIHALHTAGLQHDRAQLPALLALVQEPTDHYFFYTAVHALARLGDPQALPALEAAIHKLAKDPEPCAYAEVARARLLADREAHRHSAHHAQVQARLTTFLDTLHLDAQTLNTTVAQDTKRLRDSDSEASTRAQYALRELADMIYHLRDLALAEAAKTAGIDFTTDMDAKYKVQLASLTSQQRVDWIIEELSNHRPASKYGDLNLMQLAADEGKSASRAAGLRLLDMDTHRKRYTLLSGEFSYHGFTTMFRIINAVGDTDQAPIVAHFLHDENKWVAYYANQVYPYVQAGLPWKYRIGY